MNTPAEAPATTPPGDLYLVRHGQTSWSVSGQHTSHTDLPLTPHGEQEAQHIRAALAPITFDTVLVSPRQRARRTAELAGFGGVATIDSDLAEWDYGAYEGKTTEQIVAERGTPWDIWSDGVIPGETPGETPDQVYSRAKAVLERVVDTVHGGGNVALFAHAHILRMVGVAWVELAPVTGRAFVLGTATISVLGYEHDRRAIKRWNIPPTESTHVAAKNPKD